jgi:hypothetical protein
MREAVEELAAGIVSVAPERLRSINTEDDLAAAEAELVSSGRG